MELRVWVDGTQRVVCGVKLTTTCQEIVFALAHATQQAGRFTMIERWRNNERLLSPNEQPLVTLQRWGDRMNEVEFILKKTSTDPQPTADRGSVNHIPTLSQQSSSTSAPQPKEHTGSINDNDSTHQQVLTNGHRESPANHASSITNQSMTDQSSTGMLQQVRHYDPNRRPQTVIGQFTSSNSASNLGSGYIQTVANRLSNSFRPSLSTSTLPNPINNMTAPPASSSSLLRPRFQTEHIHSNSPSLSMNDPHNGYQMQNEQLIQHHQILNQSRVSIPAKNYPYEDLYSTINKKRINHLPPAVPAKPRIINPTLPQQSIQANNGRMNFYPNSGASNMYPNNLRPRHPPGYLEYLEVIANRNSRPPSLVTTSNFVHQNQQLIPENNYGRQFESQLPLYNNPAIETSPAGSSTSNQYLYHGDGRASLGVIHNFNAPGSLQSINPVKDNIRLLEPSGTLMNRKSAAHARNISISQSHLPHNAITSDDNLNTSVLSNASSVSQMALDLLKVIGEQKKVLMHQKNELDRLDNDQEYIDAKQSSEQTELINLIESEIRQLEELWKENQTQINKLENHDYESELEQLKSEQVRMEHQIASQKIKLKQCESDIAERKTKIEQLESELSDCGAESDSSAIVAAGEVNPNGSEKSRSGRKDTKSDDLNANRMDSHADASLNNGTKHQLFDNKDSRSSDDEEDDDDSGGDASDDLNTYSYESSNKLRCTKEAAYVDKRGLISGIRSLKLEKSRALNKSIESLNSNDSASVRNLTSSSPVSKDKTPTINNNILDTRCTDAPKRQEFKEKTANSNNYEFLMTL